MLKSVFEFELIDGMHKSLIKQANNQEFDNLTQAVDHLNSVIDIFENQGLTAQANKVLNLLIKIAKRHKKHKRPKRPDAISNGHTQNLTSEKMVENLKHHGTPFNMIDLSLDDDSSYLNLDTDKTFEDELDDNDYEYDDDGPTFGGGSSGGGGSTGDI